MNAGADVVGEHVLELAAARARDDGRRRAPEQRGGPPMPEYQSGMRPMKPTSSASGRCLSIPAAAISSGLAKAAEP